MKGALVAAAVVLVAALPGAAHGVDAVQHGPAAGWLPEQNDESPAWSADGTRIFFATTRRDYAIASVAADDGTDERTFADDAYAVGFALLVSPDRRWLLYERVGAGTSVTPADVWDPRPLPVGSLDYAAWSPDSRRVAFVGHEAIWVVDRDGSNLQQLAPRGYAPAWSPDGSTIAFISWTVDWTKDSRLALVSSSGGPPRKLLEVGGRPSDPRWSPDGKLIAFTYDAPGVPELYRAAVVRPDGSGFRIFRQLKGYAATWLPGSRRLIVGGGSPQGGLTLLDVTRGTTRVLTEYGAGPSVSPDGKRIAFAAGGECMGRSGIHVIAVDGKQQRRLTNRCRIVGTEGPDVLGGGDYFDIVLGLGGDDTLYAANFATTGDRLYGGAGDDHLFGARGIDDWLHGGPGNDVLRGNTERDVLQGGKGRDRLVGGDGGDWIYTRDGERDVVVCGDEGWGRDRVYADRHDVVGADCELVYVPRRGQ
jgi:dipeptidyl aminopeptidase/acylaminoacyl peptidase